MQIDERIEYEETYESEEYGTTTHYFMADKSLLEELFPDKYPEAESTKISIEFPTGHPESNLSSVMVSPTKDGEDYDWTDIEIPYDEIEELLRIAEKYSKNELGTLIQNAEEEMLDADKTIEKSSQELSL